MVDEGGVKVAHMIRRILQRLSPHCPADILDRLPSRANQLDAGRAEVGHWKIAGQMRSPVFKADIHRQRFDQISLVVPIVERSRAKE